MKLNKDIFNELYFDLYQTNYQGTINESIYTQMTNALGYTPNNKCLENPLEFFYQCITGFCKR